MTVDTTVGHGPDPFAPLPPLAPGAARIEAERCLYCYDAACTHACPTGIDVPGFIRKIATGNVEGAARTILSANPLGATCGAACPVESLCEGACVRNAMDRPIAIGRLQRYAVESYAAEGGRFFAPGDEVGLKVAVVGAGPAGLAAAAELRRAGVGVTLYDAHASAGGLGTYGIVPWRLPRETVAVDVAEVERSGARFVLDCTVGEDVDPAALLAGNDAVVVAVGLGRAKPLGIPGEDLAGVVDALDLIGKAIHGEEADLSGKRVAVVGGGSTAFDAAAAAVRHGAADVTLYYRRGQAETPAYPHAIDLARSLGVAIHWLTAPLEIRGDGTVTSLVLERMALGEPDASGRRRPVPVEGSRFEVPVDVVVRAVGQGGPTGLSEMLAAFGVPFRDGVVPADPATGRTGNAKVWAIGDVTSGGAEVVNAVQHGKVAAASILDALGLGGPHIVAVDRTAATVPGVDLAVDMAGIRSPNPFWLASCPISNTGEMVSRAFDAGWGGAVWKTIGEPIRNVTARLGSFDYHGRQVVGINNIELISDRPTDVNIAEIRETKKRYPDNAVVISLMVEAKREAWHEILAKCNDTGADGYELNFGCPHGMSERGMGAAVGQVPEYVQMITEWVMEKAEMPVLVKLTPEHHGHPLPGARGARGERRRRRAHQHDQQPHRREPRLVGAPARRARQGLARRLCGARGEADRAEHGLAGRRGPAGGPAGLRHRRHRDVARRRGLPALRRDHRPGGHERHALRVPPGRRPRGRPLHLPEGQGPPQPVRAGGQGAPDPDRLGEPGPGVPAPGADRPGEVHPLQPVLRRLRGRCAPGDQARPDERHVDAVGGPRLLRGLPALRVRLSGGRLHHVRGARGSRPDPLIRHASARMGRMHAHRPILRLLAAWSAGLALLWLAAGPAVLAKEGMEATLVGPFPADVRPGSTVVLVVDVTAPDAHHGRIPVFGSPIGIRLVDIHGATTEAMGGEDIPGSGRYRFTIAMPPGRVIAIRAFIRGTSDLPIAFVPDPLAPATSTEAEPQAPPPPGPGPVLVPTIAGALAGLLVLAVLRRRRQPAAT